MSSHPAGYRDWPREKQDAHFSETMLAREMAERIGSAGVSDPEYRPPGIPLPELQVVSAASFEGIAPPERSWIVAGLIPDRTVSMVTGDGATGKSTLMLQLAAAAAAGVPWIGTNPEPGPVAYVSAEDDLDELHRRLTSIARGIGASLADLENLHLIPLAGRDAVLAAPEGKAGVIGPTALWRALAAVVSRLRPRLLVIDTLADVFAGNENARAEARQFVGLLRGLAIDHNLAVVLISHPSLTGLSSGSGTSGSTAWNNSVRSRLYLETIKDETGREVDATLRVMRVKKSNYGPAGVEWRLRWQEGCFVLDGPAGGFDKVAAEAKAERVFLTLLALINGQGRDVSPKPSRSFAPTVFSKHPDSEGLSDRQLAAAMERLLGAKQIHVETFGPPSHQRSKLAISQPNFRE